MGVGVCRERGVMSVGWVVMCLVTLTMKDIRVISSLTYAVMRGAYPAMAWLCEEVRGQRKHIDHNICKHAIQTQFTNRMD